MTGGIGGVHRNGHTTMDISADLTELGRTPVAVICAGVKSVLDIGRTLEYLVMQLLWKYSGHNLINSYINFFMKSITYRLPHRFLESHSTVHSTMRFRISVRHPVD